ncbi:MAG TPA: MmgE/PrpD family protein [Burkholderiales bacterium]|nr:MmgE/PrpD family protein [Burkholderiales bacterium]
MYLTEKFAKLVTETSYGDIPEPGIAKAKECILDCIGVTIAGSAEPIREPVMQYVQAVGGASDATLMGIGGRTSVTNAALANGVFGHVLDYDDTNQIFIGHGSVVIVPAILALAEKLGSSGKDVLTAYLLGTEVQWKLGEALVDCGDHYAKGWHSTGSIGAFGATASAAKLLGLSASQAAHAFGIAASETGGFQEQFGTHCKPFHAGRANEVGVRVALLAKGGFTSARSAFEGKVGWLKLVADKYDLSKVDRFGEPWGILEETFGRGMNLKAHPVCASALGAVEGMQSLAAQHGFTAGDVETIECGVRPHSLNILMYHEPKTGLQAKFSAEYWPAITLLRGRLGLREITDEVVSRPDVQALIGKVKVYPDPSITVSHARVNIKVVLKNGRTLSEAYYPAKGATDNPLTRDELVDKFNECAEWGGVPASKAARTVEIVSGLERAESVAALMDSVVR